MRTLLIYVRMDVINFISKTPGYPDAPITRPDTEFQTGDKFFACGPRLHEYLLQIGNILKEYDAFSVGEMPYVDDPKEILNAVGYDRGELNMIFHFEMYVTPSSDLHQANWSVMTWIMVHVGSTHQSHLKWLRSKVLWTNGRSL